MSPATHDVAVIGGGIVGLATAYQLLQVHPRTRLVVLEKERALAQHQTGHNSGVIHSGIYYKPGSFKARLCVEGARQMVRFCQEHSIKYELCGKVVVATHQEELPRLQALYERGVANGVPGLELVGPERLRELEPHVAGIRGIWSPATGIADYPGVAEVLAAQVQARGGEVRTGAGVQAITRHNGAFVLQTSGGEVQARQLINCAGLHADRVARMAGARPDVRIVPFRGEYYFVRPERRHLVRNLIYPVPDPRFPFLGVHFTRTVHGDVEAGPNAVLALRREGYRKSAVRPGDVWAVVSYAGFWRMAARYWRVGLREVYRSLVKRVFVQDLQRLVPDIRGEDVAPGGAGVRAQALDPTGALVDDFRIVETPGAIHVLNAPSPAATASLAIGRYIVGLAERAFELGGSPTVSAPPAGEGPGHGRN